MSAAASASAATATYAITPTVATPVISPGTESTTTSIPVTITCASGATCFYTNVAGTTGSTPSSTNGTKFTTSASFTVTVSSVVEAIATETGYSSSGVAKATYTITPTAATPVITPGTESTTSSIPVTITCATGATCYYTNVAGTTGSTPSSTNGTKFTTSASFTVTVSSVVEAIATETGYTNSGIAKATYTITPTVATPVITPGTESTTSSIPVTITCATGATCFYTNVAGTTGSTPSSTNGTKFTTSASFTVTVSSVVEAIATETGYTNSAVAKATYTITPTVATPVISPGTESTTSSIPVTITCATGATCYYTNVAGTTGSTPSSINGTKFTTSASFTVTISSVVEAIATETGYTNSGVASATYTITPTTPTPTFSLAAGNHPNAQLVTISDTNAAVTIYYTLGNPGTTPGPSSNVYAGGALTISTSETLEAYAVATGYTPSAVAGATFTLPAITTPTTTLAVTSGGSPVTTLSSGSQATLTATVVSGATAVTPGTVIFCDGTATTTTKCTDIHLLGTAQLTSAGTAAINLRPGIGNHTYNAIFAGTSTYSTSSSSNAQLAVTGSYLSTTTITGTGVASGQVTLTAQVAGVGSSTAAPSGTVSAVDTSNANAVLSTASLSGANSILAFSNVQTIGTGAAPLYSAEFMAVGDFHGNGWPDLALVNGGNGNVTILQNNGAGTFTAEGTTLAVGYDANFVAVGDFDGDGNLDLAVANEGYQTVTILLGDGQGGFREAANSPVSVGLNPYSIAVGDFNGDGNSDLAVANNGSGTVTILLGNGDGTFTAASESPVAVGREPSSVVVSDLDSDGKLDLAVANEGDNTVTILLGNGDGTFTASSGGPIAVGADPWAISVGDFDGDGKPDLAVANGGDVTVSILMNQGGGVFKPGPNSPVAVGDGPGSIAVGDFDGDGKLDLAVGSGAGTPVITILLGQGGGVFQAAPSSPIAVNEGFEAMALGDFNGDGIPDLAEANNRDNTVTIIQTNLSENATATITGISPVGGGTHYVEAVYGGDSKHPASTSGTTPLAVPWIANVSPSAGPLGGSVTITGSNFGSSQGVSSVAFNSTPATSINNWSPGSIQAVVPPGTTTGSVVVTVNGVASNGVPFAVLTISLTSSANPSNYGAVTFTATFSMNGLSGPVTFLDNGTQIGTGAITGTTATYTTSSLAVGTHSITASWPGNPPYPPITSSPVLQTVQNTPAVYSWPWPSDITFGQALASSQLVGGSAAVSGTFAWTAPGTIPPVGAPTESVTFTPSDTTDYSSVAGSVAVTVDPIESPASSDSVTYTYDSLGRVYQAQYTTSSGTITVTYSYDSAGNRTSVVTQ